MTDVTTIEAVEEAYHRDVERAEAALLEIDEATPVSEAVAGLEKRLGVSERAIREAVMNALYAGLLHLTSERALVPPRDGG